MKVPARWHDTEEWLRKVAEVVNELDEGKVSSNNTVTLTASSATTVVKDYRVGSDSVILFMPLTANAAAELYGATMYVTSANIDPRNHQFTITHASNSQTDRDFRYIVLGQTLNDLS